MLGKFSNAVSTRGSRALAKDVAARGHAYIEREDTKGRILPVNGSSVWFDVVPLSDEPSIRMGNDGHKYWIIREDGRAGRRGFICVQHGLDLPHTVVTSSKFGALTPTNVVAATGQMALNVAALGAEEIAQGQAESGNSHVAFMRRSQRLDTPRRGPFRVYVPEADTARGQALLTPEAMEVLGELAQSFDVETRDGRLWAHSSFGDIVTGEDDTWAWGLSAASRLVDLARIWGSGPEFAASWAEYTAERVERPRRLDGMLSRKRREK